jgi:hypothetical protein
MENKKRLIDADELVRKFKTYRELFFDGWDGFFSLPPNYRARVDELDNCIAQVINAPTIDAVEVVRCKDCNFWRRCGETNKGECDGMEVYGLMDADDYCSFGERKENDRSLR